MFTAPPGRQQMASSIGLLNEKSLHAQLKLWYAEPGDRFEVPVDGYIVDIVRGDLLIEIQTRGFSAIRHKLRSLIEDHALRVVYPIAVETWILKLPSQGRGRAHRRRSPRRGSVCDVFSELVAFPDLIARPGFSLEVLLTREEELRQLAPGRRRRPSWRTLERRLLDVADRYTICEPADLARWLPDELPEPFGTAELARASGRPRWLAQKMTYCMSRAGAISEVGHAGRAKLYSRTADFHEPPITGGVTPTA